MIEDVWRVENESGDGPYDYVSWQTKTHDKTNGCPGPEDDFIGEYLQKFYEIREEVVFGFETKKDLHNWFDEKELENLKSLGFFTKKMKGDILIKGNKQIVFKRI